MAFAHVVALTEEIGESPLARTICGDPRVAAASDRNRLPPAAGQG